MKARAAISEGLQGDSTLLVPTIVLAEIFFLSRKKRVPVDINSVLKMIDNSPSLVIVPFDTAVFQEMLRLPDDLEIHDSVILATSKLMNCSVVTNDRAISRYGQIIW